MGFFLKWDLLLACFEWLCGYDAAERYHKFGWRARSRNWVWSIGALGATVNNAKHQSSGINLLLTSCPPSKSCDITWKQPRMVAVQSYASNHNPAGEVSCFGSKWIFHFAWQQNQTVVSVLSEEQESGRKTHALSESALLGTAFKELCSLNALQWLLLSVKVLSHADHLEVEGLS